MVPSFNSFLLGLAQRGQIFSTEIYVLLILCLFVFFFWCRHLAECTWDSLLYCSWQVVTYLAGCGLQSCPMLLAKGYPDVGWNPIEGERYLSFLRFAVFVNSESHVLHAPQTQDGIIMAIHTPRAHLHCFLSLSVIDSKCGWQLARERPRKDRPDKHQQEKLVIHPAGSSRHGRRLAFSLYLFASRLISQS